MNRTPMGMKYTKSENRVVDGVRYYHHRITGSDLGDLVERLGWGPGTELIGEIKNGKLVIERKG